MTRDAMKIPMLWRFRDLLVAGGLAAAIVWGPCCMLGREQLEPLPSGLLFGLCAWLVLLWIRPPAAAVGRSWTRPVLALSLGGLVAVSLIASREGGLKEFHASEGRLEAQGASGWHYQLTPRAGTLGDFEELLANAKIAGKPVMIDFFAEWCAACKELERLTYVEPSVATELGRFIRVKVDSTDQTDLIDQIQKRFGVVGLPTLIFFSSRGELLADRTVMGFIPAEPFLGELKKVD
jgi:thiol:disulfide interchange protein